ncbi:cellobiose dehydrogenase (acceptor) [Microdochium nivale]|nr:cellobiose dehydrogenase (acceptor) [Microdochium nivale]
MRLTSTTINAALLLALGRSVTAEVEQAAYDYIVAGGGTAGIVAAEQLARSGQKVLLLERGGPSFYVTGNTAGVTAWNSTVTPYDVPALVDSVIQSSNSGWCDDISIRAGCLLGGTSVNNGLMFIRPRAADFAKSWPASWQWDNAGSNGIAQAAADLYEKLPGTILASADGKRYNDEAFDVVSRFLSNNGWSEVDALNNVEAKELVYTHPVWSINAKGLRDSPVRAHLDAALAQPGFSLELNAKVVRAVRGGSNGNRVTGVEVERANGTRQIIPLSKSGSLVLAAGTHSTPRVLFNSGIGPAAQLETVASGSANITLPPREQWLTDLPVGLNMKDHAVATIVLTTRPDVSLPALPATAVASPDQATIDMFAQASGLLTQASQRLNFFTSVNTTSSQQYSLQGTVRATKDNTVSIKLYLTHGTTSTGALAITADGKTNTTMSPLLQTASDVEALKAGVDMFLAYARLPNSILTVADNVTAEALTARDKIASGSHYIGTARMGAASDGRSVVDENAKVWGVDNLFVVDGSIHPEVPTGNTQAPIMVVAAYAARRILALSGQ